MNRAVTDPFDIQDECSDDYNTSVDERNDVLIESVEQWRLQVLNSTEDCDGDSYCAEARNVGEWLDSDTCCSGMESEGEYSDDEFYAPDPIPLKPILWEWYYREEYCRVAACTLREQFSQQIEELRAENPGRYYSDYLSVRQVWFDWRLQKLSSDAPGVGWYGSISDFSTEEDVSDCSSSKNSEGVAEHLGSDISGHSATLVSVEHTDDNTIGSSGLAASHANIKSAILSPNAHLLADLDHLRAQGGEIQISWHPFCTPDEVHVGGCFVAKPEESHSTDNPVIPNIKQQDDNVSLISSSEGCYPENASYASSIAELDQTRVSRSSNHKRVACFDSVLDGLIILELLIVIWLLWYR